MSKMYCVINSMTRFFISFKSYTIFVPLSIRICINFI